MSLLLFSLTESLLMRYHLISYDRKPLTCQPKTYETEKDNCIWLYRYKWYVKFLLFTLFILLFLLLFSPTESLLTRYHLISYDRKPLICQSKTYETERDNCIWLYSYKWYVKFLLFTLFILLFSLPLSLTESLLMRYHLLSYDRKPLICQLKTYETERDNCIWLYSYRWYINFLLFTLVFCRFIAIFANWISSHEKSPDILWPEPLIRQSILPNYIIIAHIYAEYRWPWNLAPDHWLGLSAGKYCQAFALALDVEVYFIWLCQYLRNRRPILSLRILIIIRSMWVL